MRRLTPRAHAWLDVASVGLMLLLPPLLHLSPPARTVSFALAGAGVAVGSVTDYPYPLRGPLLLSFQAHAWAERVSFLAFLGLPRFTRTGRDRGYFLAVLTAYLGVHLFTDWTSGQPGKGRAIRP